MDTKTLDALKASIAHWQENLAKAKAGERFELGQSECALCGLFAEDYCNGCPVRDKTEVFGCIGTPYGAVQRTWSEGGPALIKATEDEVEFLQFLLPPEEKA